ncbi:FAS-associated factor 1-like isoform X2 [Mercenaria mercenaria]|uniref:FAS-associated factor 1-like isoform X2 n=1 Tax=Mercenaria mercenaria TaxID=6596 RepID=UPI00234E5CF6|nr:FAS-associated factor 1-like isoform X2 [Mercenaria mercenaria]
MASGEREQILADFQACTQLDDIETCIAILDQHDWNLMQAVQSVMSQTDSPTGSVPQPMETAMLDRPLGDEYFSSGILSDPVPWRSDANVIDAATNFDPGSASGAMPGTSGAGLGSHNKRMLHFNVEYRNRNVDVFIDDSCTVAQIKEQLSVDLGIPISKQELKGWANRKVTDNALLRDLHLPKENTLFLLTPDFHQIEPTATTSSSVIDNLSRNYNLKITCKENSKYHQFNLNFPGTKTVEEVKRDTYNVSDIPVRHQIWTGWPEAAEDSKAIGCIGLSYPSHMLELTRSNLSSTSRKTVQEAVHEIEISEDEDEEYFQDSQVYDDSELFSHDDHTGGRRKQDPLMPESVKDETEALEHFTREFRERYGETHPVFYVGSLDNAIKDALVVSARERKLLAIYLHHDSSILANVFCSQIFCNVGIVNYLTTNFLTWAWDMTLETNSARLITMATRHFGSVAANQIRSYKPDNLPVLLIISRSRATNEVVDVIRGDVTVDELMSKLLQDQEVFSQQQQRDIAEEAEREARENIRTEQDAAYQESLEADRKKERSKIGRGKKTTGDRKKRTNEKGRRGEKENGG